MNAHDLVKKDPKYNLLAMTSFMPVLQNIAADIADTLAAIDYSAISAHGLLCVQRMLFSV